MSPEAAGAFVGLVVSLGVMVHRTGRFHGEVLARLDAIDWRVRRIEHVLELRDTYPMRPRHAEIE